MFRDEMASQYASYTVIASYIKVMYPPEFAQRSVKGIFISKYPDVPPNLSELMEQHQYNDRVVETRAPNTLILRSSFDAKRTFKTSFNGLMSDDGQRVPVGQDPPVDVRRYFIIWEGPFVAVDTLQGRDIMVEMIFITQWRDPIEHTQS